MELSFTLLGLSVLVLAWLFQVIFTLKGDKKVRPCFAGLQLIGITLLVVDAVKNTGSMDIFSWLNALTALGALIMLILVVRK